jgi:methionine synthase II (cobalamin-independent)
MADYIVWADIPDIAAFTEEGYKPGETVICTGKIKHVGSTYTDQFDYLKSLVPEPKHKDLKLTLAAPNWYHLRYKKGKAYPEEVYQNEDDYFADIAAAYQAELRILYEHGARNIQFDDPNLACKSACRPEVNAARRQLWLAPIRSPCNRFLF